MNPFLIFLIIIACFLFWLLCSFLYKPIGRFAKRLVKDAKEAMSEDKNIKEKEEN